MKNETEKNLINIYKQLYNLLQKIKNEKEYYIICELLNNFEDAINEILNNDEENII